MVKTESVTACSYNSVGSTSAKNTLTLPQICSDNDDSGVEAELTSLSWLQSLDITSASHLPTPPCSPPPPPPPKRPPKKMSPLLKAQIDLSENAEKYRTNCYAKPPYSYATLICLAMRANNNKLTLSSIYSWIKENFIFYSIANPAWKNSIRHNLSLNKCFVKLPRSKGERGKGGFWKLDIERLEDGKRTRRRNSSAKKGRPTTLRLSNNLSARFKSSSVPIDETSAAVNSLINETFDNTICPARINNGFYETPPSSVSPPIPETLSEVPESTQVCLTEDDLTGLLIDTVGWDENQLDLLDSLLDTL